MRVSGPSVRFGSQGDFFTLRFLKRRAATMEAQLLDSADREENRSVQRALDKAIMLPSDWLDYRGRPKAYFFIPTPAELLERWLARILPKMGGAAEPDDPNCYVINEPHVPTWVLKLITKN